MARVAIPITEMSQNAAVTPPSATAVDGTNHHNIAAKGRTDTLFLEVIAGGTTGNGGDVIIKAGVNPPAFRQGLGDLTVTVGDGVTKLIGPFESARFCQADGSINVDTSSLVGTFRAFRLPKP